MIQQVSRSVEEADRSLSCLCHTKNLVKLEIIEDDDGEERGVSWLLLLSIYIYIFKEKERERGGGGGEKGSAASEIGRAVDAIKVAGDWVRVYLVV